ncbi:MAG: hypothetical protein K2Q22_02895, partial [Cytophagales bacterium]|nr:hypothetical protein [Cytophagales bacterium]
MLQCSRKKDSEFFGAGILPAKSGFAVTNFQVVKTGNFLFSTGDSVFVYANFNQRVSWKISITGTSSGANISFSGISDTISNKNNVWKGESSNVY